MKDVRSRRVVLTFDTDGLYAHGTVIVPCDTEHCAEPFHAESFHSAKAIAAELSEWAEVFLAIAEAEGEA
jgi:hypothetical protein